MAKPKTVTFVRLDDQTRKVAKELAVREERNLASMLRTLIKEALAARQASAR